jgi:hypothetical protein
MFTRHRIVQRRGALLGGMASIFAILGNDGVADAHFRLVAPGNVVMQSADGSPQKMGPCGNEAPQTPSNVVTPFRPGDTVTIRLEETIFHPGHYRVALAPNATSELPADPPVTPGSTACGSTVIQSTPAFPVLADGMLQHTQALNGEQSFQVKLPTNVSCSACTLQIIEFMSSHAAPCFYYHCAKISIQAASDAGASDAGRDGSAGAGGGRGDGGADATGGAAGTGSGGSSGAGGATGSGGSSTGGGAGSGGATGSGGTAGAAGSSTDAGTGGGSTDSSGCSCGVAATRGARAWSAIALGAMLSTAMRRRRAPRSKRS